MPVEDALVETASDGLLGGRPTGRFTVSPSGLGFAGRPGFRFSGGGKGTGGVFGELISGLVLVLINVIGRKALFHAPCTAFYGVVSRFTLPLHISIKQIDKK